MPQHPERRPLWAILFDQLAVLYPDSPPWQADQERYQRSSYAFFVRLQLNQEGKDLTLAAVVKAWAEMIALTFGQPWPVMAAHLRGVSELEALPESLREALAQAAGLSPAQAGAGKSQEKTDEEKQPENPATPAETSAAAARRLAQAWAEWLTQPSGQIPADATLLSAKNFKKFLRPGSPERSLLVALVAERSIFPDQLLRRFPSATVRRLITLLASDQAPANAGLLANLSKLLVRAQIYSAAEEADLQLNRYALLRLLGAEAATNQAGDFIEQLLVLVAKEQEMVTSNLATQLLKAGGPSRLPTPLRRALEQIIARVSEAAMSNIAAETAQQRKEVAQLKPAARAGIFYRAALAHYLREGEPPWWEETNERPDQLFARAMEADVVTLCHDLTEQPEMAAKLFPFLSAPTFKAFVEKVHPPYAGFLFAWADVVDQVYRTQSQPTGGAHNAWLAVWNYTIKTRTFSSNDFMEAALLNAAAAGGMPPTTFHRLLREEVKEQVRQGKSVYFRMDSLLEEFAPAEDRTGELPSAPKADQATTPGNNDEQQQSKTSSEDSGNIATGSTAPETTGEAPDWTAQRPVEFLPSAGPGSPSEAGANAGAEKGRVKSRAEPSTAAAAPAGYEAELTAEIRRLRHFLFYGTPLPGQPAISRRALDVLQERIIRLHPLLAKPLYRAVLADGVARQRLIRFFPVARLEDLLDLLIGQRMPGLERFWADLEVLLPAALPQFRAQQMKDAAVRRLLDFPAVHQPYPDLTTYPEYELTRLAGDIGITLEKLFINLQAVLQQPPPGLRENWSAILAGIKQRKTTAAIQKAEEQRNETLHQMEDALYIHNSGLVILAPFLKRYFTMLEMLEDNVFSSDEAAIRGVLLLEYLVSGRTEVAEHELVFNKVLCGLDPSIPVPNTLELTEHEIEVSRQLLSAVLQNWEKMSNSSLENLRASFLLRDGLLLEHDAHWSLKVETKGFDILLSFLPWTISVISLPWVKKRLEVAWDTRMG